MPKIIIPNAFELYQLSSSVKAENPQHEWIARQFYCLRFLWLLEPGDIILLLTQPSETFLLYLAYIKQIDLNSLTIIVLNEKSNGAVSTALTDDDLIKQLKDKITNPAVWFIQTCFYNQAVLNFAKKLQININPVWFKRAKHNFALSLNSKVFFRQLSYELQVPNTQGIICTSTKSLAIALQKLIKKTGQLIVKQDFSASGKGNIGVAHSTRVQFFGVSKIKTLAQNCNATENLIIALELWNELTDQLNQKLIVEVYYPNDGTFTAHAWIPPKGNSVDVVNFSRIRMEPNWIGIQTPANELMTSEKAQLINDTLKLASAVQKFGYEGYICCDAIKTYDGKILFTEMNVRPGAEINAHYFALSALGKNYAQKYTLLTRKNLKLANFKTQYDLLKQRKLLFNTENKIGIGFLTIDEQFLNEVEYIVIAPNLEQAIQLEKKLLTLK